MTSKIFDDKLAMFCSPVLLNHKVSNLVSISKKEIPNIGLLVDSYNKNLEKHCISIEKMCECGQRILLLVYRKDLLKLYLNSKGISEIMEGYGYKKSDKLEDYLTILKSRMNLEEFPHEIGAFLGYPVDDVVGFIENKGKNYSYCGYWKVYGNREEAIKTFSIYDKVRFIVLNELKKGRNLFNIIDGFQNIIIA